MYIVSACLAGVNCKYSGGNNLDSHIRELVSQGKAILICPEQLGGCPTPRPAAELDGVTGADVLDGKGRVRYADGNYVTEEFIKGAIEVLEIAKTVGVKKAILKARSPSCGCGWVHDGSFSGRLVEGNGVTAELLIRNGIDVITENEIEPSGL